jgi:hypothetical protein
MIDNLALDYYLGSFTYSTLRISQLSTLLALGVQQLILLPHKLLLSHELWAILISILLGEVQKPFNTNKPSQTAHLYALVLGNEYT